MASSPEVSGGASSTQKWSMNETEKAYNLEITEDTKSPTEDEEWKLNIPKVMPLIGIACWKDIPTGLPSSIYANAPDCRPVVQATIITQNYIKVKRPRNCSFTYRYKCHRMQVEVNALYKNIDEIRITNTIDNSIP